MFRPEQTRRPSADLQMYRCALSPARNDDCRYWSWLPATLIGPGILALTPLLGTAAPLFEPPGEPLRHPVRRAESPMTIDGRFDEAVWRLTAPISDFVQREPDQGAAATYPTQVRVAYDNEALYIAARCDQPPATIRIQNLERDFDAEQNDRLSLAIDGFLDQRSAVAFEVTPAGNQRDLEVLDGRRENVDWNARWLAATRVDGKGWQAEIALPWRNLRYRPGAEEIGLIITRDIRYRNEQVSAPPVPRAVSAYRMAYALRLNGLDVSPPVRNISLNPYVLARHDDTSGAATSTESELGGELKWAISPGTVLDLTVNTDFAQAEVDRQAVNLERFSVFFPERRQFFLENASLFDTSVTRWIQPFFSRRIGLDDLGQPIPLTGGARLTSRSTRHEVALLAMRQERLGQSPAANFGVARYARNLAEQSRIGGMVTYRRDEALAGENERPGNVNMTFTLDGTWQPNQVFGIKGMLSRSQDDATGGGIGGQLLISFKNSYLYAGLLEYYNRDYAPGIGLEILDTNYVMHSPALSLDLRSAALPEFVRSFDPGLEAYIFQSSEDGDLLFGYAPLRPLSFRFANGGNLRLSVEPNWQRLDESFSPAGVEIGPGDYDYTRYRLSAASDPSAVWSLSGAIEDGDYFDGKLTTLELAARYSPSPRFALSFDAGLNQLRRLGITSENRDTRLYSLDVTYAWSPRMRASVFAQRNSLDRTTDWNARLVWEFRPLSYLYVVYNGSREDDLDPRGRLRTDSHQLIVKFSYQWEL